MGDLEKDVDKAIADAKTLGAHWLVASSPKPPRPVDPAKPWTVAMKEVMTREAWQENAGIVSRIAPKIAAAGLTFGYHNHDIEFIPFGGKTGLEMLLAASPKMRLELDLGWVAAAGLDPAATIRKYTGRVELLHIKDMVKDTPEYRSVEIGKGIINWKPAFEAARAAKVQGFFIEQEAPFKRPIFDSLAISVPYLKAL
jgi:sugar phosphate isomerase/epimerase